MKKSLLHDQQIDNQELRKRNELQLIPALQSYQTFIRMNNDSQLSQIIDSLVAIEFLRKNCPEGSSLRDFIMYAGKSFTYECYKKGQIIFNYGEYGDKVFMILNGEVAVLVPKGLNDVEQERDYIITQNQLEDWTSIWKGRKTIKQIELEVMLAQGQDPWLQNNSYFEGGVCLFQKVYTYFSGQTFGDVALYTDKPRTASILVTSEELHVITLNKSEYKLICEKSLQELNNNVDYFMRMLPGNSKFVITKFMQNMHKIEFAPQTILWKEGDESKFFFLIIKGRVELKKKIGKHRITLCQLSDNAWVGQEEIIDTIINRTTTCQCSDNTIAYYIQTEEFSQIKRNFSEICKQLKEKCQIMKSYMNDRLELIMKNFINQPEIHRNEIAVERKTVEEIFHSQQRPQSSDFRSYQPQTLSIRQITNQNKRVCKKKGASKTAAIFIVDPEAIQHTRDMLQRKITQKSVKKERVKTLKSDNNVLITSVQNYLKRKSPPKINIDDIWGSDNKASLLSILTYTASGHSCSNSQQRVNLTSKQMKNRKQKQQSSSKFYFGELYDNINSRINTQQSQRIKTEPTQTSLTDFIKPRQNDEFDKIQRIHSSKINKTNPDNLLNQSISSQVSSAKTSTIKSAIKVYQEMKEDNGCKLALRYHQLKIILSLNLLNQSLKQLKQQKVRVYFDTIKNYNKIIRQFSAPTSITKLKPASSQLQLTRKKSVSFQPRINPMICHIFKGVIQKQMRKTFTQILIFNSKKNNKNYKLLLILLQIIRKRQKNVFKRIIQKKSKSQNLKLLIRKIQIKINKQVTQPFYKLKYSNQQFQDIDECFQVESESEIQKNQTDESYCLQSQEKMTAKEQLAMKFASTSLLVGVFGQVMLKLELQLFLAIKFGQAFNNDIEEKIIINDEYSQSHNLNQEEQQIKPKIIASNQIYNVILRAISSNFSILKTNQINQSLAPNSLEYYKSGVSPIKKISLKHQKKLQQLVQKAFKEDDTQQKSTDITNPNQQENKTKLFSTLPGVRYVTQFSNVSLNTSQSEKSQEENVQLNYSQSINTLNSLQSPCMQNQDLHDQLSARKKEPLNQIIKQYLSPKLQEEKEIKPIVSSQEQQIKQKSGLNQFILTFLLIQVFFLILFAILFK